jgi:hypothetical protein
MDNDLKILPDILIKFTFATKLQFSLNYVVFLTLIVVKRVLPQKSAILLKLKHN